MCAPAYMTSMTNNYNPDQKRGGPANAGNWTKYENSEPEGALPGAPKPPVTARLRREAWDGNDNLIELGVDEFDVRAVLDTMALDDIDTEDSDQDDIYFAAARAGLVAEGAGPFTVYLDDTSVADYLDARRAAGQVEPLSTRAPRRSKEQVNAVLDEARGASDALERKTFELEKEALAATILERFPTATEIEIYNALAEDGDILFSVESISEGKKLLWDRDTDEDERDEDGYDTPFENEMLEHSTGLDRYGMGEFFQPAATDGSRGPWFGYTIE